jgi:small subunit ribosomal protein S13
MVKLIGVDLPRDKTIEYALTYIYGIGLTTAKLIIIKANLNPTIKTNDLSIEQIVTLRDALESLNLKLEGDLRRFNNLNIKHLDEINCYRGQRHRNNLPVRGQRTRTNARTRRGSKKSN